MWTWGGYWHTCGCTGRRLKRRSPKHRIRLDFFLQDTQQRQGVHACSGPTTPRHHHPITTHPSHHTSSQYLHVWSWPVVTTRSLRAALTANNSACRANSRKWLLSWCLNQQHHTNQVDCRLLVQRSVTVDCRSPVGQTICHHPKVLHADMICWNMREHPGGPTYSAAAMAAAAAAATIAVNSNSAPGL